MKLLRHLCVALLAVVLVSCGCGSKGSRRTKGLSIEDLKAKLESLKVPYEGECIACNGTGKATDDETGRQIACPECKGTGQIKERRGPAVEDFYKAVGEPSKREDRDLIWEYWYYKCSEGPVRILAFEDEQQGDIARIVTGDVELVK